MYGQKENTINKPSTNMVGEFAEKVAEEIINTFDVYEQNNVLRGMHELIVQRRTERIKEAAEKLRDLENSLNELGHGNGVTGVVKSY
jgi:hypothetical protein